MLFDTRSTPSSVVVTLVGLVSHSAHLPLQLIRPDTSNATKYFAYLASIAVYNIAFHPLKRFQGPLSWAASRLPWATTSFAGKLPFVVVSLHAQYGPIVRIAPDELSFIDPSAWKDIMSAHKGRPIMQKDHKYLRFFKISLANFAV
jgi:hypothetical protein